MRRLHRLVNFLIGIETFLCRQFGRAIKAIGDSACFFSNVGCVAAAGCHGLHYLSNSCNLIAKACSCRARRWNALNRRVWSALDRSPKASVARAYICDSYGLAMYLRRYDRYAVLPHRAD